MINKIPRPPFFFYIALQILFFIFILLQSTLTFPILLSLIIFFLELSIITLGILQLHSQKNTKKYFFITWEIQIFLFLIITIILQPEETFAVQEVSSRALITIIIGLVGIESVILAYLIFKEKIIKKILFILASSTTIIVFLIVFFVALEGIPAFQENDPIEFITGTRFDPLLEGDFTQKVTIDTIVTTPDFEVNVEREKVYVPPLETINTTVTIKNKGDQKDTYQIDILSELQTSVEKKYVTIPGHKSETFNVSITAAEEGILNSTLKIKSNQTGKENIATIQCFSSEQNIFITPNSLSITLEKEKETITIPFEITYLGQTNNTFDISIDSTEHFRPSIAELSWDYSTSSTSIEIPPNKIAHLTLIPRLVNKIPGTYYLNITVTSQNDPDLTTTASYFFDYTQNSIFNVDENTKQVTPTGTVNYTLSFSDDIDEKTIRITPTITQGSANIRLYHQNETILTKQETASVYFSEETNHNLTLSVSPKNGNLKNIQMEIESFIPARKPVLGILPFIIATILTTIIAIFIAAPLGLSIAMLLAEFIPQKIRNILLPIYELLAGIPSVIYGLWGFLTFGPFLSEQVYPFITNTLGKHIEFFSPTIFMGRDTFTASIVLSIMILPIVITLSENSIRTVKKSLKEGSLALGATRWQTMRHIILPNAKSGIVSSIILGTGRAIGETMAVLMIMGGGARIPTSIFDSTTTMTGAIAIYFESMFAYPVSRHALFGIGLILFIMVFSLNVIIATINRDKKPNKKEKKKDKKFIDKILRNQFLKIKKEKNNKLTNNNLRNEKKFLILDEKRKRRFAIINKHEENKFSQEPVKTSYIKPTRKKHLQTFLGSTKKAHLNQKIVLTLLVIAAIFASFFLIHILSYVITQGLPALRPEFFFEVEKAGGKEGGFLSAIVGSVYLVLIALAVAAPLSIGSAIYVQEYAKKSNIITKIILFTSDTLASTPSIVFGAFGFMLFVLYLEFGYSILGGGLTLGFMIIPLMLRSSIEAIKSIPRDFQEGALALGATKWESIKTVILPPASPGIISGVIISMGRAIGETAAIILTVSYAGSFIPNSPLHTAASLPYLIFIYYSESTKIPELGEKVFSAAFVLILVVLIMNGIARIISHYGSRMMKD